MLQTTKMRLIFLSLFLFTGTLWAQEYKNGVRQGVVRVKFKPELIQTQTQLRTTTLNGVVQTGIQAFDATSKTLGVVGMKRVFPYSEKHEAKQRKHGLHLWYEVTYATNIAPSQAVSLYSTGSDVELVEPVLEKKFITNEIIPYEGPKVGLHSETAMPFDDPFLGDQWHYENTGQVEIGVPEGDINLFEAWKRQAGQPNVIVSIVDGGIDTEHADLKDNLWVNIAEQNGQEDVDDDGNGYIDDIHGYNFVNGNGEILGHSHGTHVAGTVAAVNNNGIGVGGVAGGTGNGDGVRLQSAQVYTDAGGGGHAAAIVYGANNGAVISQNSWGYLEPGYYENSVLDAINYFIEEAGDYEGSPMKGGIVIFAAGNDGIDDKMYPGYWPQVLTVAALGPSNERTYYSNFGTWVDIAAPGGDYTLGANAEVLSTIPKNSYGYTQGTSMACPHVSGIAALAVSEHGGPNFTPEALRLYLTSSTHDIDVFNPEFAGKLGHGYIDAALVLNKNEGIKPNTISDLALQGVAQDFFNLTWTVPVDEDDEHPSVFQIMYHTAPITEANMEEATVKVLQNLEEAGTVINYELEGLLPLTTYYVRVLALDRWANTSALSAEVSGTTNRGPDINLKQESLELAVNQSTNFIGTSSFEMENLDEGDLKWSASMRHVNQEWDVYAAGLVYPKSNPSAASIRSELKDKTLRNDLIGEAIVDKMELYDYKDTLSYGDGTQTGIIGFLDTTLTNSSALRFVVTQEEGFNLTNVEMTLAGDPALGAPIMEIYRGEELVKENLHYAQKITMYDGEPTLQLIDMEEQIFFEHNEVFWVVFHIPAGNGYCLGVELEQEVSHSANAYISDDMGETWQALQDIYDDTKVWSTKLYSKNGHLGEYITMTPAEGVVGPDQTATVGISVDATTLINGTYQSKIVVSSNDTDEAQVRLPVNFDVKGHQPDLKSVDIVDFGNVFYGEERTLIIPVTNFGYGNFSEAMISTEDPNIFEVVSQAEYLTISAREYGYISVKYKPANVGNHNTKLHLEDNQGNIHSIRLFGVGTAPAAIELAPAIQDLGTMEIAQVANSSFEITNTGQYPLKYKIPSYSKDTSNEDVNEHKFGYTYESNKEGGAIDGFIWEDIRATGVNVTDHFCKTHPDYYYYEVDLGFDFPFYDEVVRTWNITRFGVMTIDKEGPLGTCLPPALDDLCAPKGVISMFGWELDILKSGGTIHYQKMPGKFVLQYTDVYSVDAWSPEEATTFQVALFDNGDIEFRYLDVEGMFFQERSEGVIGIGDRFYRDAFVVNGDKYEIEGIKDVLTHNETVFRVKHPGTRLISEISKTEGYLNVGETEVINFVINTENVIEGNLYQNIGIQSNDPFNPMASFRVNVEVSGGGEAILTPDTTVLAFGELYQEATKEMILSLNNTGNKSVEITEATIPSENFVLDASYAKILKAKTSNYFTVAVNTDAIADLSETLTIKTSDGQSFDIALTANVVAAPQINVDVTPVYKEMKAGTKETVMVKVENTGAADLDVITTGNEWLYEGTEDAETALASNSLPEFAYSYRIALPSKYNNDPHFAWEDIIETGEKTPIGWFTNGGQFWKQIDLPFEISLYEQPTKRIWMSWQGVITTEEPRTNPPYIDPEKFPKETEPNSLIAPFFGIHQFEGIHSDPEISGIYHQVFEDRVVITWNECFDKFGLSTNYSFQAILYKNGIFKFQYKGESVQGLSSPRLDLGIVGLENKDGDDGIFISGFQKYIEHETAIVLTPGYRHRIVAGASKQIPMTIDVTNMNEGFYSSAFTLNNNTVDAPNISIPVDVAVTGEVVFEAPTALDLGHVVAYKENPEDFFFKKYYKEFEITNSGSAIMPINGIYAESFDTQVEYYLYTVPGGRPMPGQTAEWIWTPNAPWPFALQPGETVKMRVGIEPLGDKATLADVLVIESPAIETRRIPVTATVSQAPAATLEGEEVSILANTTKHEESRVITLSNKEGKEKLTYDLSLEFTRTSAFASLTEELADKVASTLTAESMPTVATHQAPTTATKAVKASKTEDFNTVLEYDKAVTTEKYLGYGEGIALTTATKFVAPEDGFKLSHVRTWYLPLDVLTSDIFVYVVAGDNINSGTVLSETKYTHTIQEADSVGSYITIELDQAQQFYPAEDFYVVLTYAFNIPNPQGVVSVTEPVANRFFFQHEGVWIDMTSDAQLQELGFMVKALEKEAGSATWVTIDADDLSGEVEKGEAIDIELDFTAGFAQQANNSASLVVHTNDPVHPTLTHELSLRVNQGPSYMIDGNTKLSVYEKDTLTFDVHAVDLEGDAVTFSLDQEYEGLKMTSVGGLISFTYTPTYEEQGMQSFILHGVDEHKNMSSFTIPVEVLNVNRAPIALSDTYEMVVYKASDYNALDFATLMEDPDGETLAYDYTVATAGIVDVFTSNDQLLVKPIELGTTELTLTGTDSSGLSVETKVVIQVSDVLSSNDLAETKINLYPVPTQDNLTIELANTESTSFTIEVFNMVGVRVKTLTVDQAGTTLKTTISVADLTTGVYVLRVTAEDAQWSKTFMKQ